MILNETQIDGINNSTVLLKQKNHDAIMQLKYKHERFVGTQSCSDCTVFDSGKIVHVGPGVQLNFDNGYHTFSCVLYGDIDKIQKWLNKTLDELSKEK